MAVYKAKVATENTIGKVIISVPFNNQKDKILLLNNFMKSFYKGFLSDK
jgi:hypothetical protein